MKKIFLFLFLVFMTSNAFAVGLITDQTADTSPTSDDVIETTNDPGGTPGTRKVTLGNAAKAMTLSDMLGAVTDAQVPNNITITNLSGTNTGDQTTVSGNAGTATALQTARTIGGVSFDGTGNITVATATGGFTVSGGNLALGTNSLTLTGSLGATGSRATKLWTADIESTNAPTVSGAAVYYVGGTDVAVADGGTGSSTASGARTNLGLAIGTDVQAYDADLADIADGTIANNFTVTGAFDFGGGTLKIPTGTSPTVNASGKIAIDTTDDQFIYYGAATRVISYKKEKCIVVPDVTAADDQVPMGSFIDAITVSSVWCTCSGTCTTKATFTLEDAAANAMTITGTNPTCTNIGTVPTAANVTAGNQLAARKSLRFNTTNTPTTGDTYELCVGYTTDNQ